MNFGSAVGTACGSFAITNIDDIFVLVTFFAEASTNKSFPALHITIGQYVGFTVLVAISLIGFGASLLFAAEPIGFLGLLPILLGIWWMLSYIFARYQTPEPQVSFVEDAVPDERPLSTTLQVRAKVWTKNIAKVSTVTVMNGADNIGTYVPLFSQAKGAEIAVYVVIYYILLGVWCAAAFLVMKQKHVLRVAQKYATVVVPLLYLGLGIFIIVKSDCYPWTIEKIDDKQSAHPGKAIMGSMTAVLLLACIGFMLWSKLRKRAAAQTSDEDEAEVVDQAGSIELQSTAARTPGQTNKTTPTAHEEALREAATSTRDGLPQAGPTGQNNESGQTIY